MGAGGAFTTLAGPFRHGLVVENSEFLAYVDRAGSPEAARAHRAAVQAAHPDASHHPWAALIVGAARFSDDGEPGGTAGGPILRAVQGQGLAQVSVVVARYFGGVKLGTGGLARAYGGAAADALRAAPKLVVRPRLTLRLSVPFAAQGALYHLLSVWDAARGDETYTARGLTLDVGVFPEEEAAFTQALLDATRGAATAQELGVWAAGESEPPAPPLGPGGAGH